MSIVSVDSLEKVYRGGKWFRKSDVHALRGVTFEANAGEVFGLLGPNGAGKTTLIKILLGVISSSGGRASLFGLPAGSSEARKRVGYLPESLRIDRHHTARSALAYYGRLSRLDRPTIARQTDELLRVVGLENRDRESVKRFSKGMLQRLGLAQALMHDPDLLVLDEPTDGLDPVGRSEVRRVIERLRDAGKTIFLNSHILHEVEVVCSHLAIMAHGEVLSSGPIEQLASQSGDDGKAILVEVEFELSKQDTDSGISLDNLESDIFASASPGTIRWMRNSVSGEENRADDIPMPLDKPILCQLDCQDQAAINAVVDRIRGRGGSLIRLHRHRQTLEDTFMRLVKTPVADQHPERSSDA